MLIPEAQNPKSEIYDLLIIGGGITGCGIALDAQSRGMKTIILEMQDFAAGTSSRSTKLIHGGLRYLKQLELKIVAETGRERAIVYKNGLHVTIAQPMLLPIVKGGSLNKFTTNLALWVYDFLAGVEPDERRKMLSVSKTLEKEPLLQKENLLGGAFYYEYRTDDARLTIEVLKKAVELGAIAKNYTKITDFIWKDMKIKRLAGVQVQDQISGEKYEIFAKQIVNATGAWVDSIDQLDDASKPAKIMASKGVHIVVDYQKLPLQQSLYFDVEDGRMVFAIPREGKTYIGTTDTFYSGDLQHPDITSEDVNYLLKAANHVFQDINLKVSDVESAWSGLRPLIKQVGKKGASEVSRKDEIFKYESGLITIAGGKLTGYRKMAERVVDLIAKRFKEFEKKFFKPCQTKNLLISGAMSGSMRNFEKYKSERLKTAFNTGLLYDEAEKLIYRYGTNAEVIFNILQTRKLTHDLPPAVFGELVYCLENEMIKKPADFFTRRTGATYFHIDWVHRYKNQVVDLMGDVLGWDLALKQKYAAEFETELENILPKPLSVSFT